MTDAKLPTVWHIEEWIPPQSAVGDVGYWTALVDGRFPFKTSAISMFMVLAERGRKVRVVECRRHVVVESPPEADEPQPVPQWEMLPADDDEFDDDEDDEDDEDRPF